MEPTLIPANPRQVTPDANHPGADILWGWSIFEDTGAATAQIRLRKGSVTGAIVFTVNFVANESTNIVFPKGVPMGSGTFVEEVSGSVTGTLLGE